MNCQAIDLKAYSLGEATPAERREAELHVKTCADCRDELAGLQLVQSALGSLREEDPPRRIAFVSDKVFEPTWWQRFWASGPRVGFAGAGLLSAAILVHAFSRPPVINSVTPVQAPLVAQRQINEEDIRNRIDSAVAKAVAQAEEKQNAKVQQLLAATEKKYQLESQALQVFASDYELVRKQNQQLLKQTAGLVKQ